MDVKRLGTLKYYFWSVRYFIINIFLGYDFFKLFKSPTLPSKIFTYQTREYRNVEKNKTGRLMTN